MTGTPTTDHLQSLFLNTVRREKVPLTIFLVSGIKLNGTITWFDNYCVLLQREKSVQLVYKHAISTVMPASPIRIRAPGQSAKADDADADDVSEAADSTGTEERADGG